jgi:hypothetical protein
MFTLNLEKAKEIWLNKYRKARKPILEKLDVEFMRAFELGNAELIEEVKSKKQQLRDITLTDLSSIQHPDDLRNIWPEILGENQEQALLNQAQTLAKELGFTFNNGAFAPPIMQGQENLKSIFDTTPGLNIAQEGHLINFVYNYISSAIDVKYNSKVNVAVLMKDLKTSYNEIVDPTKDKVETLLSKLVELDK